MRLILCKDVSWVKNPIICNGKDYGDSKYVCLPRLHIPTVHYWVRERSGSVVECLTRNRGDACSSLTSVTVLCP